MLGYPSPSQDLPTCARRALPQSVYAPYVTQLTQTDQVNQARSSVLRVNPTQAYHRSRVSERSPRDGGQHTSNPKQEPETEAWDSPYQHGDADEEADKAHL